MTSPSGRGSPLLYPWMGSLVRADGSSFCGAVLISGNFVLTAASCVKNPSEFQVVLGVHNHAKAEATDHYNVSEVKVHPEFKVEEPHRYVNDLALLKLQAPVTFAVDLRPICLSTKDDWKASELLNAVGWGQMSAQEKDVSHVLMQVDIPEIEQKKCEAIWAFELGPTRMCAGGGKKNVCRGDEGGALMYKHEKTDRWTLAGITSFSGPKCGDEFPGVFSRTSALLPWIVSQTDDVDLCNENQI